jgi:hypothetical protein
MLEFPYCQAKNSIIGNVKTKKCYVTEAGIPCQDCIYHQSLLQLQLPQRYWNKIKYIAKFAIHR